MRLLHWNSHHGGKGSDDRLSTARFGDALAALQPDIVTLNEIEQHNGYGNLDQIETLRQRLGAVAAVGVHTNGKLVTPGSVGQANAIVSRWPITDVQGKGLPGGRAAIAAVVQGVTIVATHLDDGSDSVSRDMRAAEVKTLLAWPPMQATPIVVCGDWNAAPGAVEIAPLVGSYEDAWLIGRAQHIATAFNGTGDTRHSRIDAVFSKGLQLTKVDVPDTRVNGMFPSDHHPIVAEFEDLPAVGANALTATEASVMTACAAFAGYKSFIETWTLLAATLEVPLEKIQEAGAIAEQLQAWCQKYGPWDVTRPRRT